MNALAIFAAAALTASALGQTEEPYAVGPVGPVGPLVIAGDGIADGDPAIWTAVLSRSLSGRPVCVLAMAGAQPPRASRRALDSFETFGGRGTAVVLPVRAGSARLADRLQECGGFWFTGGDPSHIVDTLRPGGVDSAAARAIRRAHDRGAVIGGTSAGAAMMSDPMIGDDHSGDALVHGTVSSEDLPGVWVRPGMGFLLGAITDPQHSAHGRFSRLLVAVAGTPSVRSGYWIDENTALIVEAAGISVVGSGAVVALELDRASTPGDIRGTLWMIAAGDRLDPRTGEVTLDPRKTVLTAAGSAPAAPPDAWTGDLWCRWLEGLARSTDPIARVPAGPGELEIAKQPGFRAVAPSPSAALSAGPFRFAWPRE